MRKHGLILSLMLVSAWVYAMPAGGEFVIQKSSIDSGGGQSSGGDFVVTATIGQHDANPQVSAGGNFQLAGGFWNNSIAPPELIFADGFEGE